MNNMTNDLGNIIICRDIEYIFDKTKTDFYTEDDLKYNFEEFKKVMIIKILLYINQNFDMKKKEE